MPVLMRWLVRCVIVFLHVRMPVLVLFALALVLRCACSHAHLHVPMRCALVPGLHLCCSMRLCAGAAGVYLAGDAHMARVRRFMRRYG